MKGGRGENTKQRKEENKKKEDIFSNWESESTGLAPAEGDSSAYENKPNAFSEVRSLAM